MILYVLIHFISMVVLWKRRKSFYRKRLFYGLDGFGYGIYAWNQRNFSLKGAVPGVTNPSPH
jgi:hypothetical protein